VSELFEKKKTDGLGSIFAKAKRILLKRGPFSLE